jgi:hypothetical protein
MAGFMDAAELAFGTEHLRAQGRAFGKAMALIW